MYVREKTARGHTYLYIVESEREGGRVRQRIIRALGRKDMLLASGEVERLAASLVRHCDRAIILSDMEAGRIACTRIGGPLLFGRLWERLGIAEVLGQLLTDRGFEFAVERAVFASVLHRLFVSGSDGSCEKWMTDYRIAGIDGLQLHHFYWRAAETWHRHRPVDGRQVHITASRPSLSGLASFPAQSHRPHRRRRSVRGSDDRVQTALRAGHPGSGAATARLDQCDSKSNRRVDRPADHRSIPMG